ncbi:MAG: SDR family oxidoreductase [Cupriavidus sp.]|nr:MAG: SDR family oxidoreductase [Cupriavidus sp.]
MKRVLENRTALITGGGTGIGRATAIRLAEEGAKVWIAGPNECDLAKTCKVIGPNCRPIRCDVTNPTDLEAAVTTPPRLDILVANAGVSFPTPAAPEAAEDFRRMIEVNQWGTTNTCLLGGKRMISEGTQGRIVMVTSILASLAEIGSAAYGMSKAALGQLTRQLACEWAPHGLLINAVAPGGIHSPMSYVSGSNEFESDWFRQFFVNPARPRIPLRRPGTPEEVAEGILFLCNPRNSYCTGQTLTIDGGLTIAY